MTAHRNNILVVGVEFSQSVAQTPDQRINRLFYSVGTVCLSLALLLSLVSTRV